MIDEEAEFTDGEEVEMIGDYGSPMKKKRKLFDGQRIKQLPEMKEDEAIKNALESTKMLAKKSALDQFTADTLHETDPMFRNKTQQFDIQRPSTQLTGSLNVDTNLLIQLDSCTAHICKQ